MRLSIDTINNIKYALIYTKTLIKDIALLYKVSYNTIVNINRGHTYRDNNLSYPLRKIGFSNNEIAFIHLLATKYTLKQIHIIMGQYSYTMVNQALNTVSHTNYIVDEVLEHRLKTFTRIIKPHKEFISSKIKLTKEDAIYILFLKRFNVPDNKIIPLFLDLINNEMPFGYEIDTIEDLEKYIHWKGTVSYSYEVIKHYCNNHYKQFDREDIYYNDMNISLFTKIYPDIDIPLVKEMINFSTKETFDKRIDN